MTSLALRPRTAARSLIVTAAAVVALSSCGGGTPAPTPPPPPPAQASPPGVPQNVRVRDRGPDFIEWQWDPVSGAAGYQVQVSFGDDDFSPPDVQAVLGAQETAARLEGDQLTAGTAAYLRVRAFTGTEAAPVWGQFSGSVSAMTTGAPPATDPGSFESDRERLIDFYDRMDGEDWLMDEHWGSDRPIDEWYGVAADENEQVTEIVLDDNNVAGPAPAVIGGFSEMRVLRLEGNALTGVIPPAWNGMREVRVVDLSGNDLDGDIPPDLAEWGNIEEFDLGGNDLTGVIPPAIATLTEVQRLDFSDNRLHGEIPHDLAEWGQLRDLDLSNNDLEGEIPRAIGRRSPIRSINVRNNRLTGRIPEFSGEWMDYLENLDLGDNEIGGEIPPELGNARRIRGIDLGNNRITGIIPPQLGNLTDLVDLDLGNEEYLLPVGIGPWAAQSTGPGGGNALTGPIPPELGRLRRLERLNLSGNDLSGAIPAELGRLTALEALNLANNRGLSGRLPDELTSLRNLDTLRLDGTSLEVPNTPAFRNWLAGIPNVSVGDAPPGDLTVAIAPPDAARDRDCSGWMFCPDDGTSEASAMASINPAATVQVSAPATISPEWISGAAAVAVPAGAPTAVFASVRWDALQRDVVQDGATFRIEPTGSGETMFVTCGPFGCSEAAERRPTPPDFGSQIGSVCGGWDPTLDFEVGLVQNHPLEPRGVDVGWMYTSSLDFAVQHAFSGVPGGVNLTVDGPDGAAASRPAPLSMGTGTEPLDSYDPALGSCLPATGSSYEDSGIRRPRECFRTLTTGTASGAVNYLTGYSVTLAPDATVTWGRIAWAEFADVRCPSRTFQAKDQLNVCSLLDSEVDLSFGQNLSVTPTLEASPDLTAAGGSTVVAGFTVGWAESFDRTGSRFVNLIVDVDGDGSIGETDLDEGWLHSYGDTRDPIQGAAFVDDDGDPMSDVGKVDLDDGEDDPGPPNGVADNDGYGRWSDAERACTGADGGSGEDLCDAEATFDVEVTVADHAGFGCLSTATIEVTCTWDAQGGLQGNRVTTFEDFDTEGDIADFLRCTAEYQP